MLGLIRPCGSSFKCKCLQYCVCNQGVRDTRLVPQDLSEEFGIPCFDFSNLFTHGFGSLFPCL